MTGRGVDQILPHPSNPRIHEPYMRDARGYVQIAEQANGPIRKPVAFSYIWGETLEELERAGPDLRLINLETSITKSGDYWKGKQIHYRMHPENVSCLTAAGIDFCALANNHVLDWGYGGLLETLKVLEKVNIETAGAGVNLSSAESPAVMPIEGKGRVVVFALGSPSSGIFSSWAADAHRPGLNLLPDFSEETLHRITEQVRKVKQPGDIAVASIHWGSNWGYEIPRARREFAHALIDRAGIDLVHGHSSHHVRPIEVYKDRLILYGCGDFLNDYEGIRGHEAFRGDLALIYFASIDPSSGCLLGLDMTPMKIKNFRLSRAERNDSLWLRDLLNRIGLEFGTRVQVNGENRLTLLWD